MPTRVNPSRILNPLLLLFIVAFLSSCGTFDYIGAYFNTFYNAEKNFKDAETEIWSQPETKTSGRNLLLPLTIPSTAKQNLTTVIDKCSKLLQYHSQTSLVDDALMLITKSFYYQGDFARAERKCKELLNAYPNSSYVLEARMYLALSLYKENALDEALKEGLDVVAAAEKDGDDNVDAMASMLVGTILRQRKDYAGAMRYFDTAGKTSGNQDFRAEALLSAANLYALEADSADALQAYSRLEKESRNYVSLYKARLGQAKMLIKMGRIPEGQEIIDQLRWNLNFKEFWGEVDLESANAYRESGNLLEALDRYKTVDTAYAKTEVASRADLSVGEIYESAGRYDSASVWYIHGATGTVPSTASAKLHEKGDLFARYRAISASIYLYDSLYDVLTSKKVDSTSLTAGDSTAHGTRGQSIALVESDTAAKGKDSLSTGKDTLKVARRPVQVLTRDSLDVRLADAYSEMATLFFAGMKRVDSAHVWFDTLLTRYPRTRHTALAWYSLAQMVPAGDTTGKPSGSADSLYRLIIDNYPLSQYATEARRVLGLPPLVVQKDSAELSYRQAEEYMLDSNYVRALQGYRAVVQQYPHSEFSAGAQYAAGWLYEEKLNQPDSALALYRRLAEQYPRSKFAALVKPRLDAIDHPSDVTPPPPPASDDGVKQGAKAKPETNRPPIVPSGRRARSDSGIDEPLPPPTAPKDSSATGGH